MSREHAQIALRIARDIYRPTNQHDLAIHAILADLTDRRGLKQEWYQIDPDTRKEITQTWRLILLQVFPPAPNVQAPGSGDSEEEEEPNA